MRISDWSSDVCSSDLLVPQDQGRPRFHITVQNKVEPAEAKALADELRRAFRPRPLAIAGLADWHYRGGPWELAVKASFRGCPSVRSGEAAFLARYGGVGKMSLVTSCYGKGMERALQNVANGREAARAVGGKEG